MDRGLWHCTGDRDQDHPHWKEMQKGIMIVWGCLTNSCEKKRSKKQRRKGKIFPFECGVPKYSQERQESLPQRSMQRNRGKQQNGKDWRSLQENLSSQGNISCKDGIDKGQKWYGYFLKISLFNYKREFIVQKYLEDTHEAKCFPKSF